MSEVQTPEPEAPEAPAETSPVDPQPETTEPTEPTDEPADPEPAAPEPDTTDHAAAIASAEAALAEAQRAAEPWVDVAPLDTTVANPGAPDGSAAEIKVVTHDGVSFFHTLASLPAHLKNDLGDAVFGRHHHVTPEGPA